MLINLIPDFLAVLHAADRSAAYGRYFESHRPLLDAYWRNYVVDPDGPHYADIVRSTVTADRQDLLVMLERLDVVALTHAAATRCAELLEQDVDVDIVLMVGVGAANAGELVIDGRGAAFICLEHFTSIQNPDTQGLGLDPELVPLWLSHEIAHAVRYTSPTSRAEMRTLVADHNGTYSYWETGRRATLRELILNEGLAVQVSRAVSPGHAAWEYYGYDRKQYGRIRELEPMIRRTIAPDLDRKGLGLRLKFLSGGTSADVRTVERYVIPERSGYYLGARMAEAAVTTRGLAWSVRASADELTAVSASAAATA